MKKVVLIICTIIILFSCSEISPSPDLKEVESNNIEGRTIDFAYWAGGSFNSSIGNESSNDDPYEVTYPAAYIGKTEVQYWLWSKVYNWAINNGYTFANSGVCGGGYSEADGDFPVTDISWRDAMLFCNALTDMYNANNGDYADLRKCYYTDSEKTNPIYSVDDSDVSSTLVFGSQNLPYDDRTASGFRMLYAKEWQGVASYISENNYSPLDLASGANDMTEGSHNQVAWYYSNSDDRIHESAGKAANGVGCFDMSGNICELVFGHEYIKHMGFAIIALGGDYDISDPSSSGFDTNNLGIDQILLIKANEKFDDMGFRIAVYAE